MIKYNDNIINNILKPPIIDPPVDELDFLIKKLEVHYKKEEDNEKRQSYLA